MKKLSLFLLTLFIFSVNVFAQNNKELDKLRKETSLPSDEIIRVNKDIKFPANKTLKVLLAINQSGYDARKFEEWIEKWNRKDGKKYGNVELVGEPDEADVIVAQFRTVRPEYVLESRVNVGNVSDDDQILSNDNRTLSNRRIKSETDYRRLAIPTRSYLLVKVSGFWTVVFRDVETSLFEKQKINPYTRIRGAFKKRLKKR